MRLRNLGTSELVVSVVGLGTNNFGWRSGEREAKAVVDAALGRRRGDVVATKFGWTQRTDPRPQHGSRAARTSRPRARSEYHGAFLAPWPSG